MKIFDFFFTNFLDEIRFVDVFSGSNYISPMHFGCHQNFFHPCLGPPKWSADGSDGADPLSHRSWRVSGDKKSKILHFFEKFPKCPKWVENMFL